MEKINFRVSVKSFIVHDDKVLILKRSPDDVHKPGIWEIPGGRLELGEDPRIGLKREIEEETGLINLEFIQNFRSENIYNTISKRLPFKGQIIEKHSIYFLCEAKQKDVKVDNNEIIDHKWLSYAEAKKLIIFKSLRDILHKAQDFLINL